MLHFRRVLKTTVNNSSKALRFEDEILETRCVNSDIMTPGVGILESEQSMVIVAE